MTAIGCPAEYVRATYVARLPLVGYRNYYRYAALGVQAASRFLIEIQCIPGADHVDGQVFGIQRQDTGATYSWEFNLTPPGGPVVPPNLDLPYTGAETDAQMAVLIANAINAAAAGSMVATPAGSVVSVLSLVSGAWTGCFENVIDPDFAVTIRRYGLRGANLLPLRWGLQRGFAPDSSRLS